MKIIVCVKQVPDSSVPIDFDLMNNVIREESIVYVINEADESALQEALRIKSATGAEITVISAGPRRVEETLRYCLSLGADNAVYLKDEDIIRSDAYATGRILASLIGRYEYQLILCGTQSSDSSSAQVGPTIAEFLNIPQITYAIDIKVDETKESATVTRLIDRGDQMVIECPLPAVISVQRNIHDLPYPTLPMRIMAREAFIQTYDLQSLGLSNHDVGVQGSQIMHEKLFTPRPKTKGAIIPDNSLSVTERINLLLSSETSSRGDADLLEGDPEIVADKIVDYLAEEGYLMG